MSAPPQRHALLCVTDRSGIVEFAQNLTELGFTLHSFGATAKALKQFELKVNVLPDLRHAAADLLKGTLMDIVAVNLFPIDEVLTDPAIAKDDIPEYVDVFYPAIVRSAAQNFIKTVVLTDPKDYDSTAEAFRELGQVPRETRRALAAKAFHYTAYYDATVAQFLTDKWDQLPDNLVMSLQKIQDFGYGENPHQRAAVYRLSGSPLWGITSSEPKQGKNLNYNHFLALDTAVELTGEFDLASCVITRHAHPVGAAMAETAGKAFKQAFWSDPSHAHRGVVAFNREIDSEVAESLEEASLECVIAPEIAPKALEILKRYRDLRIVILPPSILSPHDLEIHSISGGLLIESKNHVTMPRDTTNPTKRKPTGSESVGLNFAWKVAKHAKSYATVLAQGTTTVAIGSGQSGRLDALKLALMKSRERHPILKLNAPLVLAADTPLSVAYINEAAHNGVSAIIQPGGTNEDPAVIQACEKSDLAMVFTGLRHFRH